MGSSDDRWEHGVSLGQAEATAQAGSGIYRSLCEIRFRPTAMITAPGPRCRKCACLHQRSLDAWQPHAGCLRRLARVLRPTMGQERA
jgi:hypothetical protein